MRQLLGHRSVQTTINSYIGLESIQASEIFSNIVMAHMALADLFSFLRPCPGAPPSGITVPPLPVTLRLTQRIITLRLR